MNTTQAGALVLKTDLLGRVKTPVVRRESLLDEFERSGLSGKKFAALAGIKYQTFATWAQQRRRGRGAATKGPVKPAEQVRWLEAVVEQAHGSSAVNSSAVVLQWPCGVRVEIADVKQVELAAALVRALAKSC